jgi:hypothetical protein
VHVVSVQGRFAATDYDIFDVETHHVLAEGHTLEALTENVDTVVVAPGQYKIVRQGAGFHAAVDFVNVLVPEGHVVNAVLVVDPENGQFRGGGVVANEVPEGHDIGGLHVGLSLGGDLMVNQRSHVVGTTDGLSTNIGLFGNFGAVLDTEPHLLSLSTIAELGLGARPFVPVARTHDRLQATALYTYKINNPYIGPYVRAAARTSLFPGYQYFDDETTIILHDANGQPTGETVQVDAADKLRFQVSDSLAPFVLQESLGANLHAVDLATLHVSTRVGYAVRHGWFPGLLVQDETLGAEISSIARFRTVPSYLTHGPEAGADATFKFFRLLYAQGGLNFLVPVEAADHWILDAHASVGVNVGGIASFSYSMRTERDPFVVDSFQLDQTLFARAHWNLL